MNIYCGLVWIALSVMIYAVGPATIEANELVSIILVSVGVNMLVTKGYD